MKRAMKRQALSLIAFFSVAAYAASPAPDLEGSAWVNYCDTNFNADAGDVVGYSTEWKLKVSGDVFTDVRSSHADANCSGAARLTQHNVYRITDARPEGAQTQLALNYVETRITPGAAAVAQHLNATRACGFTDWRVGSARTCAKQLDAMTAVYAIEYADEGQNLHIAFGTHATPVLDESKTYFWRFSADSPEDADVPEMKD